MINNELIQSYIKNSATGEKIALPIHLFYLSTDNIAVSENSADKKYKIYPSMYYQTQQHILVPFYKTIF